MILEGRNARAANECDSSFMKKSRRSGTCRLITEPHGWKSNLEIATIS